MSEGERFAAHDGTLLAYRTLGSGPLLVCLAGGPGRAAAYLEDLGGLAATRTLLLLDSRGTGGSALPADDRSYAAETLADDVEALREHLGRRTLDLLGHSAGGRVAQVWAATSPERVGRLVLVTTYLSSPGTDATAAREQVMARRSAEGWYDAARESADALPYASPAERGRLERALRPFWYGAWTSRAQAHAASADTQVAPRASSRFTTRTPDVDLRERLARMSSPVLVVTGELDALTPPALAADLPDLLPDGRLVELSGAGHFPWVDDGPAFSAAVEAFLSAPPRG